MLTRMQDDFIARATARVRELEKDDAALAAQEEGVRRKRLALQEEIRIAQGAIDLYGEVMNVGTKPEATPQPLFDVPQPGTIADMTYAILVNSQKPMTVHEIARRLTQAGKLSEEGPGDARTNYATVFGTLRRDRRFYRPAPGRFAIHPESGPSNGSQPPSPRSPADAQG